MQIPKDYPDPLCHSECSTLILMFIGEIKPLVM